MGRVDSNEKKGYLSGQGKVLLSGWADWSRKRPSHRASEKWGRHGAEKPASGHLPGTYVQELDYKRRSATGQKGWPWLVQTLLKILSEESQKLS